MIKSIKYFYLNKLALILLIFLAAIFVKTSEAEMAASRSMAPPLMPTYVPIEKVIENLQNQKSQAVENPKSLDWAFFAKDVMGVKQIRIYAQVAEQINSDHIIEEIRQKILAHDWTRISNSGILKKLNEWKPKLESKFGNDTFTWSWVQFQTGETVAAKKSMQGLFDEEYKKLMKLEVIIVGFGGSPLSQITQFEKALIQLGNPNEKALVQKRMKQVKVHISNLPESHVVTKVPTNSSFF